MAHTHTHTKTHTHTRTHTHTHTHTHTFPPYMDPKKRFGLAQIELAEARFCSTNLFFAMFLRKDFRIRVFGTKFHKVDTIGHPNETQRALSGPNLIDN